MKSNSFNGTKWALLIVVIGCLQSALYASDASDVYPMLAQKNIPEPSLVPIYGTLPANPRAPVPEKIYYIRTYDKIGHKDMVFTNTAGASEWQRVGTIPWTLKLWRYDGRSRVQDPINIPVIISHGGLTNRFGLNYSQNSYHSLAQYIAQSGRDVWVLEMRGQTEASWYSAAKQIDNYFFPAYLDQKLKKKPFEYYTQDSYLIAPFKYRAYYTTHSDSEFPPLLNWQARFGQDPNDINLTTLEYLLKKNALQMASFTFDDLIHEDIPAIIGGVLAITKQPKVQFVGHSMGGMWLYGFLCQSAYHNGQTLAGQLLRSEMDLSGTPYNLPPESILSAVTISAPAAFINFDYPKSVLRNKWIPLALTVALLWLPELPAHTAHAIRIRMVAGQKYAVQPRVLTSMQYVKLFSQYLHCILLPNSDGIVSLDSSLDTHTGNFVYYSLNDTKTTPEASYLDQMEGKTISIDGQQFPGYRITTPISAIYSKSWAQYKKDHQLPESTPQEDYREDKVGCIENIQPLLKRVSTGTVKLVPVENISHVEAALGTLYEQNGVAIENECRTAAVTSDFFPKTYPLVEQELRLALTLSNKTILPTEKITNSYYKAIENVTIEPGGTLDMSTAPGNITISPPFEAKEGSNFRAR